MGEYTNFLLTITAHGRLFKVAIRVKLDSFPVNCFLHWSKFDNRKTITGVLPSHVQTLGQLVDVELIFDVIEEPIRKN